MRLASHPASRVPRAAFQWFSGPADRPDSEIDTSDIAPLDDQFWARAAPNPFYKPVKPATAIRIDADVLAWLKAQGSGWQTRINAILREAMVRSHRW
ncbi:MAG: toxin-antitoxin system, antitoxin component [Burkholderiaceae bacterium]|nr:MAG: toxin-antitoxin system, antitoxin component [Burkholderiaceae bacterium]